MFTKRISPRESLSALLCGLLIGSTALPPTVRAQQPAATPHAAANAPPNAQSNGPRADPVNFRVNSAVQRLEMIVNSSRILTLEHKVPRMMVMNPDIIRAQPLSPNQVQISAVKSGVTQLNLWDENNKVYTVDVVVTADARELELLLSTEFPEATIRVRPLSNSVVLSGYVPSANMVAPIVRMAEDYYPSVINNITVGGVQQILLHTKIMEVSRTKLRKLGVDWMHVNLSDPAKFGVSRVSGLIADYLNGTDLIVRNGSETISAGIVHNGQAFFGMIEALQQNNLLKVLAEPTIVTLNGRAASFNSGGEIPILIPAGLGTLSVEYRQFGTRVDFVPIVDGQGRIHLEVRAQVSDVDPSLSVNLGGNTVPGLRSRWADTAAELKAGQTMAIAGLIQHRYEPETKGLPYLADLPWAGALFRRVQSSENEVELLILVTPEFAAPMDPHQVPRCGPGESTVSPRDCDFYGRGYIEVPCCNDEHCKHCKRPGPTPALQYAVPQPGQQPLPGQPLPPSAQPLPPTQPVQPLLRSLPDPIPVPAAPVPPQASAVRAPQAPQFVHNPGRPPTLPPSPHAVARPPATNPASGSISSSRPTAPVQKGSRGNSGHISDRPAQTAAPAPQATQPVYANTPNPRRPAPQNPQPTQNSSEPSLFGPIGYDVLE